MSFNKNASKRLSIIAGIDRESREVTDLVNTIAQDYLTITLTRLINLVLFCGRKTIMVEDIRFLPQICIDQPHVASASNLSKLTKVCIQHSDLETVMKKQKGYTVYTLKKPFNNLVREITHSIHREEIRIGKNVVLLLQNITEHQIIKIMNLASTYMVRDNRDTLLPRDIETVSLTL